MIGTVKRWGTLSISVKASRSLTVALAAALAHSVAGWAQATDVAVANSSFASPDVPTPNSYISDNVTSWTCMTGGGSRQGVNNYDHDPRVSEDDQCGFLNYAVGTGGGLSQNPAGHTIVAGKTYTLITAIKTFTVSQFQISLRATSNTGTILATTTLTSGYGSFTDVAISFDSDDFPALVGQSLHIVYKVLSGTVDWQTVYVDNVRLSYVPTPPHVTLSFTGAASNTAPGTAVGQLSMHGTNSPGFSYTLDSAVSDSSAFLITGTNLRTRVFMEKAAYAPSIIGTKGGFSATNSVTINVTNDAPVMVAGAEVSIGALDGAVIGTAQSRGAGLTYSIVGGRDDMFRMAGNQLQVTNAASLWSGLPAGTTSYVTLKASNASGSSMLTVAVGLVSHAVIGTTFAFQ